MVILVAGMGGHIGTTVTPIVAAQFKKLGVLTLAIVVMPYVEEGAHRQRLAKKALQTLCGKVDALVPVFNNDFDKYDSNWRRYEGRLLPSYIDALYSHIVNPLCIPGWVNIDFEDLRDNTLSQTGICIFGTGLSFGENAAQQAAVNAIEHSSFGESRLNQAKSVLFTVVHGREVRPHEIKLAIQSIRAKLASDCHFLYGILVDDCHNDMVQVNILANGIQET
jgi:cell division protein FtsZ